MKLKTITVLLISIVASTSILASHSDDTALPAASGIDLMASHQEGSWSFGAEANYFEPNYDFNYAYGVEQTQSSPDVYDNDVKSVGSDYEWGWGVDITYHFPGNGRDVTASFTQLDSSGSDHAGSRPAFTPIQADDSASNNNVNTNNASETFYGMGILYPQITPRCPVGVSGATSSCVAASNSTAIFPATFGSFISFDEVSGHVDEDYNAADLTFGQMITIGERVTLHPFAGIRYAEIDYTADAEYTRYIPLITANVGATVPSNDIVVSQELKSDFDGAGPRLGSDAAVNLGRGFSLKTTLGVSLLVGRIDNSADTSYAFIPDPILEEAPIEAEMNTDMHHNTRVVPEADAKLSAMYHMDVNQQYGLGFEAGWQVTNYFDAIQNETGSYADTTVSYDNFFLQGPYARVQLDVA